MNDRTARIALNVGGWGVVAASLWWLPLGARQLEPGDGPFGWGAPEVDVELRVASRRAHGQESLDADPGDSTDVQSDLTFELHQPFGRRLGAFAEFELRSERHFESRPDDDDDDEDGGGDDEIAYRLERIFFEYENAAETRSWRLGRQKLDDAMGWLVDAELDGFRYTQRHGRFRYDLSLTRENWFVVGDVEREDVVYNALGVLRVDASEESRWAPYVLHRSAREHDGSDPAETTWLGLQGVVRLDERFRYWLNASLRSGERQREDGIRTLGGAAVDAGLTWTLDAPLAPALTVAVARAGGDRLGAGDDGDDENFRQSGLQSNEFRLNDRNRFRYLGEVLDPELSNLEVLTLGLGLRLSRRWALDLAWHRYAQLNADDRLRGADIRYEPTGEDTDLGEALDLVVGYRPGKSFELLGVAGLFDPGAAFAAGADPAWALRLELEWDFDL